MNKQEQTVNKQLVLQMNRKTANPNIRRALPEQLTLTTMGRR
jgi:hypothetical protein